MRFPGIVPRNDTKGSQKEITRVLPETDQTPPSGEDWTATRISRTGPIRTPDRVSSDTHPGTRRNPSWRTIPTDRSFRGSIGKYPKPPPVQGSWKTPYPLDRRMIPVPSPVGGSRHQIASGRSKCQKSPPRVIKMHRQLPRKACRNIEMIHRVMDDRSYGNPSLGRCKGRYLILRFGVGYRERSWGEADSSGRKSNPLDVPSDTPCPDRHPAEPSSGG
jgi:hypothetical protein